MVQLVYLKQFLPPRTFSPLIVLICHSRSENRVQKPCQQTDYPAQYLPMLIDCG